MKYPLTPATELEKSLGMNPNDDDNIFEPEHLPLDCGDFEGFYNGDREDDFQDFNDNEAMDYQDE